jgi:hypothetical protein
VNITEAKPMMENHAILVPPYPLAKRLVCFMHGSCPFTCVDYAGHSGHMPEINGFQPDGPGT